MTINQPPLLIDTREPDPHPWEAHFSCETVRGTLPTGDFTLPGCEEWVCIERKTVDDLVGCLTSARERFTKELQRAQRIKDFYLICEGSHEDLLTGRYRSEMNPRSAWESVVALQLRYGIPFLLAGSQETAARLCESILIRWWKEHSKVLDECQRACREARKAS